MNAHPIGKALIKLIQEHEPEAVKLTSLSGQEARDRIMADLATTIAGLLAFTVTAGGIDAARASTNMVFNRIASSAPDIARLAHEKIVRKSQ
jgi:hypothetical protein